MLNIGRRTKSCDALPGFSYQELVNEALRRGLPVDESTSKEDLLESLCGEEASTFYHPPLVIYNNGKITIENVDSQEKVLVFDLPFLYAKIAGITSKPTGLVERPKRLLSMR